MRRFVSDVAFTPAVKSIQERLGSRETYARVEQGNGWNDVVTGDLVAFLAERDSFYLATASREGQPYVQHRGGSKGFLKIVDDHTLAFADFTGNQQYITLGNLSENDRAFIFLMDYAGRQRVKIWGRAEVVEDNAELISKLADPQYKAEPRRAIVFHIEAWDINCPQHITRRFTEDDVMPKIRALQARIQELENELAGLRGSEPA